MTHVMVDLETLGTRPGSVIRSIGAVVFDPKTGAFGKEFYANITRASCEKAGLVVDPKTEKWWSGQSDAAQAALEINPVSLIEALAGFHEWWNFTAKGQFIWSHGASFDGVLLSAAYHAIGVDPPWDFWNERCCRTVLALGNRRIGKERTGDHHNALDDAKSQAVAVAAALRTGIKL